MAGFPGGTAPSNGSDYSKYTPLVVETNVTSSDTTSWNTLLTLTTNGGGYVSRLLGWTNTPGSNGSFHNGKLRVTIDGVVSIFNIGAVTPTSGLRRYIGGLVLENLIGQYTPGGSSGELATRVSDLISVGWTTYATSLPFTGGAGGNGISDLFIMSQPLFFKRSLLVEFQAGDTAIVTGILSVRGGTK